MAIRWCAPTAQGTGDGSTSANAAPWTDLDNQINLASSGSAPFDVRLLTDGFTYTWTAAGRVSTLAHGGTAPGSEVEVKGWSLSSGAEAFAQITGDRFAVYTPPASGSDDVWQPAGTNGNPGKILFDINAGTQHLRFAKLALRGVQALAQVNDVVPGLHGRDLTANGCRRLFVVADSTNGRPTGIVGTPTYPATWQRIAAFGFPKQLIALSGSSYVDIDDIVGDSQNQSLDGNTALVSLLGNTPPAANHHIRISRWTALNMINFFYTTTPYRVLLTYGSTAPTSGTFVLNVAGTNTAALAYNASTPSIKQAVATAKGCALTAVFVSGALATGLTVSFGQEFNATNPGVITLDGSQLTGGTMTLTTAQAWAAIAPGYTQGDGITTEEYDHDIVIKPGYAENLGDSATDLKSVNTEVRRVTVKNAKRSFRIHNGLIAGGPPVLNHCRSINPVNKMYPTGYPLVGTKPTGTQTAVQADGPGIALNLWHTDTDPTTNVFETDNSTGQLTVLSGRVERSASSTLAAQLGGPLFMVDVTDVPT